MVTWFFSANGST